MTSRGQDITAVLKKQIEEFGGETTLTEVGTVVEVGDGIAQIYGLSRVGFGELLSFPSGVSGLALNLEEDSVGAAIMGPDTDVKEGDLVGFRPSSEYEFVIDGERLYRVLSNFITIKYEYQGDEEEYNPSWACSG